MSSFPGSFLLAHSQSRHSGYISRLVGPVLPGNMKYCLRFFFSLRGENNLSVLGALIRCDVNQISLNSRFQPVAQRPRAVPAAAAQRQPGEDLDSGREVPRNLDRSRCHLSNVTVCKGQNPKKRTPVNTLKEKENHICSLICFFTLPYSNFFYSIQFICIAPFTAKLSLGALQVVGVNYMKMLLLLVISCFSSQTEPA